MEIPTYYNYLIIIIIIIIITLSVYSIIYNGKY